MACQPVESTSLSKVLVSDVFNLHHYNKEALMAAKEALKLMPNSAAALTLLVGAEEVQARPLD